MRDESGPDEIDLRLLKAAVEATGEAILITTAELDEPGPRIEYANAAFVRLTGYPLEEVIGRSPRFLQGPKTDRAELDRTRASLEAGEAFQGETLNYRKDGSTYMVEWLITPVRDADGRITHWVLGTARRHRPPRLRGPAGPDGPRAPPPREEHPGDRSGRR